MDVQADEAGLRPDPSATAIVESRRAGGQGQLFSDAYPTYADTDRIPAVQTGRGSRTSPWLRAAVAVVAVAVLAAGAALGLVKAGVIGNENPGGEPSAAPVHRDHATTGKRTTPLVTPVSTGAGTATYRVGIEAYQVAVTTSAGRSWVSMGTPGKPPLYEGILAPASTKKEILLGPAQIDIGAGGTKVTVTSGHRSVTLTPPAAPFTYQFLVKS
jgi:hypothetical protein